VLGRKLLFFLFFPF